MGLPVRLFRRGGFFDLIAVSDIVSSCSEESAVFHKSYSEKSLLAIEIAKNSGAEKYLLDFIVNQYDASKIVFFFRQEIAREIEDMAEIASFLKCPDVNMKGIRGKKNIMAVKETPWAAYFSQLCLEVPLEGIFTYPDIRRWVKSLFVPIKVSLEIVLNSFLVIAGRKVSDGYGKEPMIAVLHAQGADLSKRADYFWLHGSSVNPQRILVYFKYYCWFPKKDTLEHINRYGMRWINLLPWKLPAARFLSAAPELYRLPSALFIRNSIRSIFTMIKLFFLCFSNHSRIKFWQLQALSDLINRITFYQTFFSICNVKIHFGLYETGIDMLASNIAIKSVGGIDLCHHWSNCYVPEILDGKPHDAYFIWGPYYKNVFKRDFYKVKHFICSGYPYDSKFSASREKGRDYRKGLLEHGAQFIVTFFDENHPDQWVRTSAAVERIYRVLLNKIIDDSRFGLITKPKKKREFWERWPQLSDLAKKAKDTKRCLFLEGGVFPNEAAQAADLVVGFGVYNTPTLEAALSGLPAISYDPQNISEHYFYRTGLNLFVFNSLDVMMANIEKFRNKEIDSIGFGNYSVFLKDVDPFKDGGSAQRIGVFISWLLKEFDEHNTAESSLEKAVEKYRTRWGKDKVIDPQIEEKPFSMEVFCVS